MCCTQGDILSGLRQAWATSKPCFCWQRFVRILCAHYRARSPALIALVSASRSPIPALYLSSLLLIIIPVSFCNRLRVSPRPMCTVQTRNFTCNIVQGCQGLALLQVHIWFESTIRSNSESLHFKKLCKTHSFSRSGQQGWIEIDDSILEWNSESSWNWLPLHYLLPGLLSRANFSTSMETWRDGHHSVSLKAMHCYYQQPTAGKRVKYPTSRVYGGHVLPWDLELLTCGLCKCNFHCVSSPLVQHFDWLITADFPAQPSISTG